MFKLEGRALNDTLVEWIGPVTGRNYNMVGLGTPIAPTVEIRVWGSGAVQLQSCDTAIFAAPSGDQNLHTIDRLPNPADWVNEGAVINEASGLTVRTVTAEDTTNFLRVIVSTAGTGRVEIKRVWN